MPIEYEPPVESVRTRRISIKTFLTTAMYDYTVEDGHINIRAFATRPKRLTADDDDIHEDNLNAQSGIWNVLGVAINFIRAKLDLAGKNLAVRLESNALFYNKPEHLQTMCQSCSYCNRQWEMQEGSKLVPWAEKPGVKQTVTYKCGCDIKVDVTF